MLDHDLDVSVHHPLRLDVDSVLQFVHLLCKFKSVFFCVAAVFALNLYQLSLDLLSLFIVEVLWDVDCDLAGLERHLRLLETWLEGLLILV